VLYDNSRGGNFHCNICWLEIRGVLMLSEKDQELLREVNRLLSAEDYGALYVSIDDWSYNTDDLLNVRYELMKLDRE